MSRALAIHLAASLALAMPALPAAAGESALVVRMCGGGTATIPMGDDSPMPAGHGCCKMSCHAGDDRRKRGDRNGDSGDGEGEPCC